MVDIVALGEVLIDFTPTAPRTFYANPGGAPANVLAAGARLGLKTAFIGMVGDDDFGVMLARDLENADIDTTGLKVTKAAPTTLAFVQLDEKGDRSFTFVRSPGADMMLTTENVEYGLIDNAQIFHFGSLSMTDEPSRSATLAAAGYAKKAGKIVSYDPNLRPPLWKSMDAARTEMRKGFAFADIVKISEEEVEFLYGTRDLAAGAAALHAEGVKLVFITLGPKGCYFSSGEASGCLPTYDLPVVDTTGAGDAFMGGILFGVLESGVGLEELAKAPRLEMLADFANATGALATTKPGGILSMPLRAHVEECRSKAPKLIVE